MSGHDDSRWQRVPARWQHGVYTIAAVMLLSQTAAPFLGRGESVNVLSAGLIIFGLPSLVEVVQWVARGRGGSGASRGGPPSRPESPY